MAVNVCAGDLDRLVPMMLSARDWLPEDHLAFVVIDVVTELDLSSFLKAHRLDGRRRSVYDPAMLLSVLLYA
jgi:transposase